MKSTFSGRYLFFVSVISSLFLLAMPALSGQGLQNLLFNSTQNVVKLDFSTVPPTPVLTDVQGSGAAEGLAHVEDSDGNILFWFNDLGVYNQNGGLMPGSEGIFANNSASEVNVALKPDDPCKFYMFYNAETCTNLYYSIVDLNLNGGLGDVTNLNSLLKSGTFAEGLEIVRVPNTCTYWLLTYQCGNGFRRFLVDTEGIHDQGIAHNYEGPLGYDGRGELEYHNGRIGMAFAFSNTVFTANFNPNTGVISNPITLTDTDFNNAPYGLEFSPDASKMYFSLWYTNPGALFQYDFDSGNFTEYNPSTGGSMDGFGQIELAQDGKLYVIQNGGNHITVIDNANTVPTFSNIAVNSTLGLGISDPVQSDMYDSNVQTTDTICQSPGNMVTLALEDGVIYEWRAGDDPSGPVIHTGSSFQFLMTDSDTVFIANIVGASSICTYTFCEYIKLLVLNKRAPEFNQTPSSVCAGAITFTSAETQPPKTWIWDFGDGITSTLNNPTHAYTASGTYTAVLTICDDLCCQTNSQTVLIDDLPIIDFVSPSTAVVNTTVSFEANYPDAVQIIWNFGDGTLATGTLTPTHIYNGLGTYDVTLIITDSAGCISQVTQTITIIDSVGIDDVPNNQSFLVSSNPFAPSFRAAWQEMGNEPMSITVFNTLGQVAYSTDIAPNTTAMDINTASFPAGIYAVVLTTAKQRYVQMAIKP